MSDSEVPQWKKDLIARLRSQNKRTAQLGPSSSAVQQPVAFGRERCECATMVQERLWEPEEDLHYGPGIVSKLKERYLSLAQRDKPPRPSVLRKAASLEDILDEPPSENGQKRLFEAKAPKVPRRYNKSGNELKRARSVEAISSGVEKEGKELKRESMHEEMLIKGSVIIPDKNHDDNKYRINRPKRIAPVMNEREKPPADVVKQAKMIFEKRPEHRTRPPQQTGEVAAKVATYKSIIGQNKVARKPVIKVKPNLDKTKTNGIRIKTKSSENKVPAENEKKIHRPKSPVKRLSEEVVEENEEIKVSRPADLEVQTDVLLKSPEKSPSSLPSPIPDISRIDSKVEENGVKSSSLSETPDLIITSSPIPVVNSPSFRIAATENFIKEEIRLSQAIHCQEPSEPPKKSPPPPPTANSMTFNFAKTTPETANTSPHLPVNKNVLNTQTPPSEPLKLEINGVLNGGGDKKKTSPSQNEAPKKPTLTTLEIENNLINTAKTLEKSGGGVVVVAAATAAMPTVKCKEVTVVVAKVKKPPREPEKNSMVFNFSHRKDVPDYVHNDGVKRAVKPEKPKVGEGGIIILPGASRGESFTDEDDEILQSLEAPPSPCDVTFINDNILIDGKSSLSQKTKKPKLKISFVDEGPEVYEYPSESSLLIEDVPTSPQNAQLRNTVPLSGASSLANYTPKSTEHFQPGVTRSVAPTPKQEPMDDSGDSIIEVERPMLFSSGANSDILF